MMSERAVLLNADTYDGTLKKITVKPKCNRSKVTLFVKLCGDDGRCKKMEMVFDHVICMDFEMNFFDNPIGSELFGLYEVCDRESKQALLEQCFENRLNRFLAHGDYLYDEDEPNDMLNFRDTMNEYMEKLEDYHLYEQESAGGIYAILARGCTFKEK